jgi:hypothetical protein
MRRGKTRTLGVMTSAHRVQGSIWLIAGLGILVRAIEAHWHLLASPEPFNIADGAEQSVLIFEAIALFALGQAFLVWKQRSVAYWPRKGLSWVLVLGASIWLLFGGPFYEPWYSSGSVALLLVASIWYGAVPSIAITPNSASVTDAYSSPLRAQGGAAQRER